MQKKKRKQPSRPPSSLLLPKRELREKQNKPIWKLNSKMKESKENACRKNPMPKPRKSASSPKKKHVKPKRKKKQPTRRPSPSRDQPWLLNINKHLRRLWLMPLKLRELLSNKKR